MVVPTIHNASDLTFIAEGGANVVYAVASDPTRLLRLRKDVANNADYVRTSQIVAYLSTTMIPRFAEAGVADAIAEHQLIRIHRKALYELNEALRKDEEEGLRHKKRFGCSLEMDEEYALLLPDLRARTPTEITIEFKPKWLWSYDVPQPAPGIAFHSYPGASLTSNQPPTLRQRRCTTCALRALHSAKLTKSYTKPTFCPLALLHPTALKPILLAHLRDIIDRQLNPADPVHAEKQRLYHANEAAILDRLTTEFATGRAAGVLRVLEDAQRELDPKGILSLNLPVGAGGSETPVSAPSTTAAGAAVASVGGGEQTPPPTPAFAGTAQQEVGTGGTSGTSGTGGNGSTSGTKGNSNSNSAEVNDPSSSVTAAAEAEDTVQDYLQAMTLRDCTLFVRFNLDIGAASNENSIGNGNNTSDGNGSSGVEVVVADLDRKVPEGMDMRQMRKLKAWAERERVMVDEGFYHGVEKLEEGRVRDEICWRWSEEVEVEVGDENGDADVDVDVDLDMDDDDEDGEKGGVEV